MEFRSRSAYGPRAASAAPLVMELSPNRVYRRGESVGLFAQAPDVYSEIRAAVLEVLDSRLRVRAVQDVCSHVGECIVRRGDEFIVATTNVFSVHFST